MEHCCWRSYVLSNLFWNNCIHNYSKKKKKKTVNSFVFCSTYPLPTNTVTLTRRVEILVHVLISQSLFASLCSAVQQMKCKQVIYRCKTLTVSAVVPTGDRNHCANLPFRFLINTFMLRLCLLVPLFVMFSFLQFKPGLKQIRQNVHFI